MSEPTLDLDRVGEHTFRGSVLAAVPGRVFGGVLVGQALIAAGRTVAPDRPAHALHALFLRPGHPDVPVDYRVDRVQDGRTRTLRRVTASQDGRDLFELSASFHLPQPGPEHEPLAVAVPPVPEDPPWLASADEGTRRWLAAVGSILPFELRFADEPPRVALSRGERPPPRQTVLLRWPGLHGADPLLHAGALACMSDALLLSTSLLPHGRTFDEPGVSGTSIDHALWLHRAARVDEWLRCEMEGPWAGESRALCQSRFSDGAGHLVASVVQEGIVRVG